MKTSFLCFFVALLLVASSNVFAQRITSNSTPTLQPSLYLRNDPGTSNQSGQQFGYIFSNMSNGIMFQANTTGIDANTASGHMVINSSGNVGIGLISPYSKLHIRNNGSGVSSSYVAGLTLENNAHVGINFLSPNNQMGRIYFGDPQSNIVGSIEYDHNGDYLKFRVNSAERLRITQNGNVGIGTTNPSYAKLQIKGGATHELFAVNRPNSDVPALYLGNRGNNDAAIAANNSNLTIGRDNGGTYTEYMRIQNGTGNVGIGSTNPEEKLHVDGSSLFEGIINTHQSSLNNSSLFIGRFNNKSQNLMAIGEHSAIGVQGTYGGALFHSHNRNIAFSTKNTTFGAVSSGDINFYLGTDGNVGIGTTTPSNKLEVNGTIRTQEVVVESTGWPDYVFLDSYKLNSLSEVSDYIDENGHLPNIPSAAEVEENGIKLGEMNAKLLEKIEELTLYLIELKDKNNDQKELNHLLIKRIEKLENK